jgi:hypothetical protein
MYGLSAEPDTGLDSDSDQYCSLLYVPSGDYKVGLVIRFGRGWLPRFDSSLCLHNPGVY